MERNDTSYSSCFMFALLEIALSPDKFNDLLQISSLGGEE
jgi:hypothetical protein